MPAFRLFSRNCRSFLGFRFGLLIMNVPLPRYSALYSFSGLVSFANESASGSMSLPFHVNVVG